MKKFLIALFSLFFLLSPARAQLTQAQVNTDINNMLTSCGNGCNTAASLRALLDILASATFQSQGASGLQVTGAQTSGSVLVATGATSAVWSPGLVGDGATDNTTAFQALLTSVGSTGGSVNIPCGTFVINSATSLSVGAGKDVTIRGQGICTILAFKGTNATSVTLGSIFSSIHWGHMRMTTDGVGTRTGLVATMSGTSAPNFTVQHAFEDMQLTGDDYQVAAAHYWSTALTLAGLSTVAISDVTTAGANGSRVGTGVLVQATNPAFAVVFNFTNYFAVSQNIGIDWETNTQGLAVVNSNFQSGNYGIKSAVAGVGLSQLSVANSQFGDNAVAGISVAANVGDLAVVSSLFEMGTGQVGISGTGVDFKIVGNSFLAESAATNIGTGIALTSAGGFGTISANGFTNLANGITATAGSTYASAMITNNMHAGTTTPYNISGGTNLFIVDIQPIGVGALPTCNSTIQGSSMVVTDNNTAAAYRGAVTAGGALWSKVFCPVTGAWVQD